MRKRASLTGSRYAPSTANRTIFAIQKFCFRRCPDCGPDSARLSLTGPAKRSHHEACNIVWRTGGCFFCRTQRIPARARIFCPHPAAGQSDAVSLRPQRRLVTAPTALARFSSSLPHLEGIISGVASNFISGICAAGRRQRRLKHPCRRDISPVQTGPADCRGFPPRRPE